MPYQASAEEFGIFATTDNWLAYSFSAIEEALNQRPIKTLEDVDEVIEKTSPLLSKLMHFGAAGDNNDFYTRVIAFKRLMNMIVNIRQSRAEPQNKVFLCRDLLTRADMMIQVAVKEARISPMKSFVFQGQPNFGAGKGDMGQLDEDTKAGLMAAKQAAMRDQQR